MSSNVIRADEVARSESVVHLPVEPDITPARAVEDHKTRIEVQNRIVREAREIARKSRHEGETDRKQALEEAASILSRAREQASAIVSGAKREEERVRAEARAQGLAAAREEARHEALEKISSVLTTLDAAGREVRDARESFLRAAIEGMMQIVEATLEEIVRGNLEVDRECVVRTLEAAVKELATADQLTVRLNPEDVGAATSWRDEILARVTGLTEVELRPDTGVSRGGVILETHFGRVDARLQSQLQELLREARVAVAGLHPGAEGLHPVGEESRPDTDLGSATAPPSVEQTKASS
jgi:flagellar assembly protein FliH